MLSINSESFESNRAKPLATKTQILNLIPSSAVKTPIDNWQIKYKTEWRWRFMKFQNKSVAEISFIKNKTNSSRLYYNPLSQNESDEYIKRDISSIYDDYVTEQYFVYTKE